ncbi:cadherin-like protein, partial [Tumebacillus sp. BK434]
MQLSYFFKRFQKVLSLSLVILLLFVASGFGQWAPQVMAATATWTTGDGKLGTNAINNVAYGNSMWMMLGGLGDYSTSSDGITFTKSPSALGCQGLAATYTDKWVVVCDAGKILTSATGASGSWAPTPSGVLARLLSIAFKENGSNDIYVAVGETGGTIIKSADGISWQNVSVAAAAGFYGVAYGEGKFIAVGESTGSTPVIYTSVDGQVWEIVPDPKPKQVLNSVAYGDGKFVAVGLSGYIYESEDGVTWNERVSNVSKDLWAVNYGAGKFYAAGANETIISSQSGITWETENTPAVGGKTLNGVAVIDGRGLAVGSTGMVKTAVAVTPSPPVSSNATLSNLQITPGSLAYHAATADYTVEVPYGTTTVTVTPTLQDTTAKMTVNGATRSSGQATPVTLDADGSTEITIQVTAQDNVTKKTYTITVNEASPPLIKLDNLAINSPGGLTYQPNTTTYNVTVPHGTHTVKVTPTLPAVAGTIVTVNGTATSGAAVDIALDADRTTEITIQVTAPGHTSNQYKIIVTEEELIKLIDLDIAPGTLNFDPDTMNYTVSVPAGTTSVELTPTVPVIAGANVTANGNARVGGKITVALDSGGSTDIVVDVTAPGYTANQYTIHVTALPLIKLDNLAIDAPGGLTFDQDTKGYAVTVP